MHHVRASNDLYVVVFQQMFLLCFFKAAWTESWLQQMTGQVVPDSRTGNRKCLMIETATTML